MLWPFKDQCLLWCILRCQTVVFLLVAPSWARTIRSPLYPTSSISLLERIWWQRWVTRLSPSPLA